MRATGRHAYSQAACCAPVVTTRATDSSNLTAVTPFSPRVGRTTPYARLTRVCPSCDSFSLRGFLTAQMMSFFSASTTRAPPDLSLLAFRTSASCLFDVRQQVQHATRQDMHDIAARSCEATWNTEQQSQRSTFSRLLAFTNGQKGSTKRILYSITSPTRSDLLCVW